MLSKEISHKFWLTLFYLLVQSLSLHTRIQSTGANVLLKSGRISLFIRCIWEVNFLIMLTTLIFEHRYNVWFLQTSKETVKWWIMSWWWNSNLMVVFRQAHSYNGVQGGVTPPEKCSVREPPNLPFLLTNVFTFLYFWNIRRRIRCCGVKES